jgi:2-polyprenyl-6-methoxyphenol hydroxylase-like FAD-dependent oxidoreductase
MVDRSFDLVITGGGLAGSSLGGVLARSGLDVLIVEKESEFRDRIRGELTFPWGHHEALSAGLDVPLAEAGVVPLPALDFYADGERVESNPWEPVALDGLPAIGFSHPLLQEVFLNWARVQGATVLRPAKIVDAWIGNGSPEVSVLANGHTVEYGARLLVGADGKKSGARRWLGAETLTDPEHHRFGGVVLSNVQWDDTFGWATTPPSAVGWFANGTDSCRVYVRLTAERVRTTGVARSFNAFVDFVSTHMPPGALTGAQQAGPMGFFPNSCTWSSRIAQGPVVLVGDAAGAVDPTQGLGTSLLFRDVRTLSELLIADKDWSRATTEFARQRQAYYEVLRAYDRWCALLDSEEGPAADRRRELNAAAREIDPTLGGFATLEARGPDGLVPDETARRTFFGE